MTDSSTGKVIIVYDSKSIHEYEERIANYLLGLTADKGIAAVKWDLKLYKQNETTINNTNKKIIFSHDLRDKLIPVPNIPVTFIPSNSEADLCYQRLGNTLYIGTDYMQREKQNIHPVDKILLPLPLEDLAKQVLIPIYRQYMTIKYIYNHLTGKHKRLLKQAEDSYCKAVKWFVDNALEKFINDELE